MLSFLKIAERSSSRAYQTEEVAAWLGEYNAGRPPSRLRRCVDFADHAGGEICYLLS